MKKVVIILLILLMSGCTIKLDEKIVYQEKNKIKGVSAGKLSSLDNPLLIGDTALTDKMSPEDNDYFDINLTVRKAEIIDYNKLELLNKDQAKLITPKDNQKFILITYDIDIMGPVKTALGFDSSADVQVLKLDGTKFIRDDAPIDIVSTNISLTSALKMGDKGRTKMAFQIEEDINELLLVFGKDKKAYYKILLEVENE